MELFRRTLAGLLMLVVAVSVGIWVQGKFIDAVRLPTHTRMIGATYTTLSDPFYETINDEIQMQIKSNGDLLLVRDPGQDQERQNQEIEDMLNKGIELLIVNPVDYVGVTPALEKAREKGVPVILIDSKVDDPELVTCTITSNNYGAGLLDARHLISQTKNARIVLLSNSDSFSSWDRLSGFCQTLTKSGNYSRLSTLMLGISQRTKHSRLSWELLKTIACTEEMQTMVYTELSGVSALHSVTESDEVARLLQLDSQDTASRGMSTLPAIMEDTLATPRFARYHQAMESADRLITEAMSADKNFELQLLQIQQQLDVTLTS